MPLQLRIGVSSTARLENKGNVAPPWANGSNTGWDITNPDAEYAFSSQTSGNSHKIYLQYGENDPAVWASTRFYAYTVRIDSEQTLADGSIRVKATLIPHFWKSVRVSQLPGYRVGYYISLGNNRLWDFQGQTTDTITRNGGQNATIDVTIPPGGSTSAAALHINVEYPDGQYTGSQFSVGMFLHNTNQRTQRITVWYDKEGKRELDRSTGQAWQNRRDFPGYTFSDEFVQGNVKIFNYVPIKKVTRWVSGTTDLTNSVTDSVEEPPRDFDGYIFERTERNGNNITHHYRVANFKPWSIRKSGRWKTLNRPSGFFKIRRTSNYVDKSNMSVLDKNQENKGVARIRRGGKWLGQNQIGEQ